MIVVDSSAIVAVVLDEPEAPEFGRILARTSAVMSVASHLETSVVIDGRGDAVLSRRFDDLIREADVRVVPVTVRQGEIARRAYQDFGRGSGHAARLNFGDCFAYALARDRGEPLLFKGDDFIHTDITPAA